MNDWLALFNDELIAVMSEHGIKVESAYVNAERTQFIWIRSYGESESNIEAREAGFYGSDWWKANVDHIRSHIAHREVKLIHTL